MLASSCYPVPAWVASLASCAPFQAFRILAWDQQGHLAGVPGQTEESPKTCHATATPPLLSMTCQALICKQLPNFSLQRWAGIAGHKQQLICGKRGGHTDLCRNSSPQALLINSWRCIRGFTTRSSKDARSTNLQLQPFEVSSGGFMSALCHENRPQHAIAASPKSAFQWLIRPVCKADERL